MQMHTYIDMSAHTRNLLVSTRQLLEAGAVHQQSTRCGSSTVTLQQSRPKLRGKSSPLEFECGALAASRQTLKNRAEEHTQPT